MITPVQGGAIRHLIEVTGLTILPQVQYDSAPDFLFLELTASYRYCRAS